MKIALTGGIASGKSTLLYLLQSWGVPCTNADTIARDLLWSPSIQARLMDLLETDEPVGPLPLKNAISSSDELRRAVNFIFHPAIAEEIEQSNATVIEVPLLFETCLHASFDAIWLAFCSRETQSKRLIERYGEGSQHVQFGWQLEPAVGLAFADSVIRTDTDFEATRESLLQEGKRWFLPLVVS